MVNNKKKKKNHSKKSTGSGNKENRGAPTTATASSTITTTTPAGVDVMGRMPERDGRQFYRLLTVLAALAVPKLNQQRVSAKQKPIEWYDRDMAANSMEARELVISYILQEIDWLVDEVETNSKKTDALVRLIVGRRLTATDKSNIRSWKLHVNDDFFVVGHIPNQGTVLAQVGRLQHRDWKNELAPYMLDGEYHEPRLFVVQSLADSLKTILTPPRRIFQAQYPSIGRKHPEYNDSLCFIHTTLLPYNGGITYMTTVAPVALNGTAHYDTPQDLAAAVDRAVEAHRTAFHSSSSNNNNNGTTTTQEEVPLYRNLHPERDAAICRLANSAPNQADVPLIYRSSEAEQELGESGNATTTPIMVNPILWMPLQNRNDTQAEVLMDKASHMGPHANDNNDGEPFVWEGMKTGILQEILIRDEDPCPFHKRYGAASQTFVQCCKASYLKQMKRAKKKARGWSMHFMYDPVEQDEMEIMEVELAGRTVPFDVFPHVRIAPQDIGKVRLTINPLFVPIIQRRLHSADLFHATLPYKWIYWGYAPLRLKDVGIVTFGDITLDPETGVLEGEAMTAGRLTALIRELKWVCTDFPILDAAIQMTPSYKTRTDIDAFERNKALLQEGLDVPVRANIDKEQNSAMGLRCGFCGVTENEMGSLLLRCACKRRWYCTKEHQRQHWKDHREECQASHE